MSSILIRLATLITGFTIIAGCEPAYSANQPTKWDVVMTSPAGQVTTYTVESYAKPRLELRSGGQTELRDWGSPEKHEWERDIVAPSGWRLEVKPHSPGEASTKAEIDY